MGGNDFNINAQKRVNNNLKRTASKKKLQPPMEGGAGSADQSVAEQSRRQGHVCFYLQLELVLFGSSGDPFPLFIHLCIPTSTQIHTVRSFDQSEEGQFGDTILFRCKSYSPNHYKLF